MKERNKKAFLNTVIRDKYEALFDTIYRDMGLFDISIEKVHLIGYIDIIEVR
jgi:hypothetical protein